MTSGGVERARRRVLMLTEDPLGERMGGAAIRAYEMARALPAVAGVDVTLAGPGSEPPGLDGVRFVSCQPSSPRGLEALLGRERPDVIVMRPPNPAGGRVAGRSGARLVFDLCDPLPLDILEARASASRLEQLYWSTLSLDHLLDALGRGHHFICASERQRDLYLGAMLARRLIGPAAYRADPSFRTFIDCVPLGIPSEPPRRLPRAGPRLTLPALAGDTRLLLWNGGIWNWLDPVTAVAAVARAHEREPRLRLVFMFAAGLEGEERREARAARELARRLGLLDRVVVFNESPIGYRERGSWLLEADCLICTHRDHLESSFSFRTRLLDCFWAGVPAVCSSGDELSEWISGCDGGAVVAPGDAEGVASGILRVLERGRDAYRSRLLERGRELTWPRVVAPLARIAALEGEPRALGAPVARRVADPLRRSRAASSRLLRGVAGGQRSAPP